MKRILSTILAALIMLSAFPVIAAAEGKTSGLFTYELKGNGTAVITGFDWKNNQGNDIYIPRMLDGYTVTGIGDSAFGDTSSAKDSGNIAVILPDTITSIGEKTFFERECIASINIPASVQSIGAGAFTGTDCRISVDTGNPIFATIDGSLYNKPLKELIYWNSGSSLNIPEGILSIGAYACYDINASETTFPSTLVKIGDYAFYGASLDNGILPTSLTSIGDYAFAHAKWYTCASASKGTITLNTDGLNVVLYIPENVNHIGEGAFQECEPDCTAPWGEEVKEYDAIILGNCKITEIPEKAFSGVSAFNARSTLQDFGASILAWPQSIETIGAMAFEDATLSLSSLPTGIIAIEESAFRGVDFYFPGAVSQYYNGFEFIDGTFALPDGLEEVGANAFADCSSLSTIVLPKSVTKIGEGICDRTKVVLQVEAGTYPAIWASENGYPTTSAGGDDTSWLNN